MSCLIICLCLHDCKPAARAILVATSWRQIQHRRRFEDARPLFRITITISQNTSSGIVPPDATSVMHPKPFAPTQMTAAQDRRTARHCTALQLHCIFLNPSVFKCCCSPLATYSCRKPVYCIAYSFYTELVVCCQLTSHQSGMHCAGLFSLKPGSVLCRSAMPLQAVQLFRP